MAKAGENIWKDWGRESGSPNEFTKHTQIYGPQQKTVSTVRANFFCSAIKSQNLSNFSNEVPSRKSFNFQAHGTETILNLATWTRANKISNVKDQAHIFVMQTQAKKSFNC